MPFHDIHTADFSDQNVCIRAGFDVAFSSEGSVSEPFRLALLKPVVDLVLSFPGARVALLTHQGRPGGKPEAALSTRLLVPAVANALCREVVFVPDCKGQAVAQALSGLPSGKVLLLENVRFYPEEEANDTEFAHELAAPFQSYINEAFSNSHRAHASMEALPRIMPAFPGLRLLEEVAQLEKIRTAPESPSVAIIGGAKIETKLPLIRAFERLYDRILIGGMIANEAIDQKLSFTEKVCLPEDFDSEKRLDIGPRTTAAFIQALSGARTIVWNGPLGKFEEAPYDRATRALFTAVRNSSAHTVVGGGETVSLVQAEEAFQDFGFVSSGGGAMLEFLSGRTLPALAALQGKPLR